MALKAVLAKLCPQPHDEEGHAAESLLTRDMGYNCWLLPCDGARIPAHVELLRARCQRLPAAGIDHVIEVDADPAVVFALLTWIYAEALDLKRFPEQKLGPALVQLAVAWGLRDIRVLKDRLMASWRTERQSGSLLEDLIRSYEAGAWGGGFAFRAVEGDKGLLVPGGWPMLLRAQSSYFEAMLGGKWAESSNDNSEVGVVTMHFPGAQLVKLIRFLHGDSFVQGMGDLQAAVECSSFFGVPSLLGHVHDWISTNLKVANAPTLWEFVDNDPRLRLTDADGLFDFPDASDACLNFHVRHFAELAADPEEGDGSWVPLHDLSYGLMRKLLSTGLVAMPRDALTDVVERFVNAKCGSKSSIEYAELLKGLRPPAVLFNRELRALLAGNAEASIRSIL